MPATTLARSDSHRGGYRDAAPRPAEATHPRPDIQRALDGFFRVTPDERAQLAQHRLPARLRARRRWRFAGWAGAAASSLLLALIVAVWFGRDERVASSLALVLGYGAMLMAILAGSSLNPDWCSEVRGRALAVAADGSFGISGTTGRFRPRLIGVARPETGDWVRAYVTLDNQVIAAEWVARAGDALHWTDFDPSVDVALDDFRARFH